MHPFRSPRGRLCPRPELSWAWGGNGGGRDLRGPGRSRAGVCGRWWAQPYPLVERVELAVAPLHDVSAPAAQYLHSEHLADSRVSIRPGARAQPDPLPGTPPAHPPPAEAQSGLGAPLLSGPSHAPTHLGTLPDAVSPSRAGTAVGRASKPQRPRNPRQGVPRPPGPPRSGAGARSAGSPLHSARGNSVGPRAPSHPLPVLTMWPFSGLCRVPSASGPTDGM